MNAFSKSLADLGAWDADSGSLNVIIETPKGSRNKFDYNPAQDLFELAKVLPKGMSFPYDFGFVPSTEGDDGDPLDVLVLMDAPGFTGCKVRCRLIGVIEDQQTSKEGKTIRNDRLVAVAEASRNDKDTESLKQLSKELVEEIAHFFAAYHDMDSKTIKTLAYHGPKKAEQLVRTGSKRFRKHSRAPSKEESH